MSSNTVAEIPLQPVASRSALGDGLFRMDAGQKHKLGIGAVALLAIALALFFMSSPTTACSTPTWARRLCGGAALADEHSLQIHEGGCADHGAGRQSARHGVRLASQGLPKWTGPTVSN